MTKISRVAPLLLRGRISAGTGLIDLLSIAAFTLSSWLLLVVVAGVNTFYHRQLLAPAGFMTALGSAGAAGMVQLPFWTLLAACAGVLLVVPVMTLGAEAARMGALGRDQRLATLRLLGVTGGQVVGLSALETMLAALVGAVAGTVGYLVTVPLWSAIIFQATPLGAGEMLLPALGIAGIVVLQVVLAGVSSATGLLRLRISPLGVARRQPRAALKVWRFLLLPAVVVAWLAVAPLLQLQRQLVLGTSVVLVALGLFMGVINLVGPWLLQLLGVLLSRWGRPAVLIAGRRLLADPKAAWRSVSGLAFVGFTGGALASVPALAGDQVDPLVRILADDLRTGTYLTVVIAFLVAAASTLLNQAAAVLDRRQELHQLGNLGVPEALHHRVRFVEVTAPAVLAALGSGGLAMFFFGLLPSVGTDHLGILAFGAALVGGIALVWAAGETCRPLVRAAVR
ncbi:MAG: hypothetical protein ACOH1Y_11365 [Propionicimonas sp.]